MAWFELQGIAVPIASWTDDEGAAGAVEGETQTGHQYWSDVGGLRELWGFETAPMLQGEAEALALLVVGAGEVWRDSDYGSKGTLLINPMYTAGSAKFGAGHFAPSAPEDFVALTSVPGVEDADDGWTVLMWHDDGGGYVHYGLSSDGTKFEAGAVDAGSSLPFSVSGGVLSLDDAGDYDDVVILPFDLPSGWISQLDLSSGFAGLPTLNASGDFYPRAVTVEAASLPALGAVQIDNGATRWVMSSSVVRTGRRVH